MLIGACDLMLCPPPHPQVEWATLLFFGALFILMEGLGELGLIDAIGQATTDAIDGFPDPSRKAWSIVLVLWVSALSSSFIDNIPFTAAMIPVIKKIGASGMVPLRPLVWSLAFGACLGGNGRLDVGLVLDLGLISVPHLPVPCHPRNAVYYARRSFVVSLFRRMPIGACNPMLIRWCPPSAGTLIGASANVVMVGLAEQEGITISFNRFFTVGFPIMLLSTLVAMFYLLLCHVAFEWDEPF